MNSQSPLHLSSKDLEELIENQADKIRGPVFELPSASIREEQPLFLHQIDTITSFDRNEGVSGIIHLPTGAGKTRVAIEIMARRLHESPHDRIIWATFPTILIRQAMVRLVELSNLFPKQTRYQWALPHDPNPELLLDAEITFLMRDDLAEVLDDAGDGRVVNSSIFYAFKGTNGIKCPRITLIYDECHQLGAEKLQKAWKRFSKSNRIPHDRFQTIGFSATPLPTSKDKHRLLQDVIFPVLNKKTMHPDWKMLVHASITNKTLVDREILCPINMTLQETGFFDIPERILLSAGINNLKLPGNNPTKLELSLFTDRFNNKVFGHDKVLGFLSDRLASNLDKLGKTLVFVPTIDAANRLTQLLKNDKRVGPGKVSLVHSRLDVFSDEFPDTDDVSALEAQKQIGAFVKKGSSPCIMVNVGMLTTGFDDPKIQTVVLGRLTFSTNLFWQMIGRGTRGLKCNGTSYCNVIDPVRLTDKFDFLEGYRPIFESDTAYTKGDEKLGELGDGALDPHIPVVRKSNISLTSLPRIASGMRRDVAEALVKFLNGDRLAPEFSNQIGIQIKVEGENIVEEYVQMSEGEWIQSSEPVRQPDESMVYPISSEDHVTVLQGKLIKTDPLVDLSWLKTTRYLPSTSSNLESNRFNQLLDIVERCVLTSEQKYLEWDFASKSRALEGIS